MEEDINKQKMEEIISEAKNFFDFYKKELGDSLREETKVIYLDFMKISEHSSTLSDEIILNPEETLKLIEIAIQESGLVEKARVRLTNLPTIHEVKIRDLRAKHLDQFIVLEGIIRQSSDVRPMVVNAKFECPSCGTIISVFQIEKKFREPERCSCGRRGSFKLLSKIMVDTQRLVIEEAPENLKGGEQPKRLNIFLREDLVEPKMEEKTTPGSRVKVIGILKEVPMPLPSGGQSTRYDLAVDANNIIALEETFEELNISEEDEMQILELSQNPKIFDILSSSIAPSVWGYDEIKKSLVLQLFGGVKKIRQDGSKTRGDIHILLIGDPGVAKSVMLGFMSELSPKGRYVVGRGASGAGLTATVVRDEYLKGWSLEAGAMVLANKGLVCIDELEKMDVSDQSAMHEAMEQQTVTISKANVQATLRSETSVLAAANPKFGRFNPDQPIPQQINLPPALINRFDMIFTMRDIPDKIRDEKIALHVLDQNKPIQEVTITKDLFRKYVAYTKQKIKPLMTQQASEEIKKFYVELRNTPIFAGSELRALPISARQLNAIIRMAEALAKIKLSNEVDITDAKQAIELIKYFLMQAGFDPETGRIDIDRFSSSTSSSQRNKITKIRDTIIDLEARLGQLIPVEEIEKVLEKEMKKSEIDEGLQKLASSGEIFHPKRGYIGRTQ